MASTRTTRIDMPLAGDFTREDYEQIAEQLKMDLRSVADGPQYDKSGQLLANERRPGGRNFEPRGYERNTKRDYYSEPVNWMQ